MSKAEDYLKQNVRGILQPMVKDILAEKPKEPVIIKYNNKPYLKYFNKIID